MGPAGSGTAGGAAAATAGGTDGGAAIEAAGAAAAGAAAVGACTPFPLAPSAEGSFRLSRGTYVPALLVTMSLSFCARPRPRGPRPIRSKSTCHGAGRIF